MRPIARTHARVWNTIDTFLYIWVALRDRGDVRAYAFIPFHLLYVTQSDTCLQCVHANEEYDGETRGDRREFSLTVTTNSSVKLQSTKVVSVLSNCAVLCIRSTTQNISHQVSISLKNKCEVQPCPGCKIHLQLGVFFSQYFYLE